MNTSSRADPFSPFGGLRIFLEERQKSRLSAYEHCKHDITEHYNIEQNILAGGYGYRQILELVQNGADAILEACEAGEDSSHEGRIHVALRKNCLYVANTGAPLSPDGLDALLSSHSSSKRKNQIGRFGIGFKSLLRLGGRIDLISKGSGLIRFDPAQCREELKSQFGVENAPGLRMAWAIGDANREQDSFLSEFDWAETIVRAEVTQQNLAEHLCAEIEGFPAEFLLFLPVTVSLTLDSGGDNTLRDLRREKEREVIILYDRSTTSRWRVFEEPMVAISDPAARSDATHIHARKTVPIAWALPMDSKREEAGRFWAFFPTHTPTYFPGILNAPWKLNNDRNAIIGGAWNDELMRKAADLIGKVLPKLATEDDPGRILDAYPRQLERADDDAAQLVNAVWALLEEKAVLPDGHGELRPVHALWRHPETKADILERWNELADKDERAQFVHPTCQKGVRASRIKVLADRLRSNAEGTSDQPQLSVYSSASWFSVIASDAPQHAIKVLALVETFMEQCENWRWNRLRPDLKIVPTPTGELLPPGKLVLAKDQVGVPEGRFIVHPLLLEDDESLRRLKEVLEIAPLDDDTWTTVLQDALAGAGDWTEFWNKLRTAPEVVRKNFVKRQGGKIRVRRNDGEWVSANDALLPGVLVNTNDTANAHILIDLEFHQKHETELELLGVRASAGGWVEADHDSQFLSAWLKSCRREYKNTYDNSASWKYLLAFNLKMPGGWEFLPRLKGAAKSRLTCHFLASLTAKECVEGVRFGHRTSNHYPEICVRHPLQEFLLQYGAFLIGEDAVPLAVVVARMDEPALALLPEWRDIRDLVESLATTDGHTGEGAETFWLALIGALTAQKPVEDDSLEVLWASAAQGGCVPESLQGPAGAVSLEEIYVTTSSDLARRARNRDRIVLALDHDTAQTWLQKGARDLAELLQPEWEDHSSGSAALLIEAVPELKTVMYDVAARTAVCRLVATLYLKISDARERISCLLWEDVLLLDQESMASLPRSDRLRVLLGEIAATGWLNCPLVEALDKLADSQVEQLREHVAAGATLAEKLRRAVGERREPLLEALAGLGQMDFVVSCDLGKLADLVLAQLGPTTLSVLQNTLDAEGLHPPGRWNTAEARSFVASIGFPEVFATSPVTRRDPEEIINGPIHLPPLHPFQQDVFDGVSSLLKSPAPRRRAVISLPTGGGKTRVTVQAAVELILHPESTERSVLWIAQSDELCEQAVQSFRQVWINRGSEKTDLRVIRLWGSNPYPAPATGGQPVVVVASIQTLNSRMGREELEWLKKPGLVIVDECHHAIAPSYTGLLRWLDADGRPRNEALEFEPPIIGLSATPFRSDDEESHRLARRFDNRWLPEQQEDLYVQLQETGVLSRSTYRSLESGSGLLENEADEMGRLEDSWDGPEFNQLIELINQRLAKDSARSERILEYIQSSDERSILLFANSVDHAGEMAARLNLAGISAAAVSGGTARSSRRYFIDRFQRGKIRVLCNHSVLTTGFDAPKVDMVLIARQVFSPVRYMQMVGRGLRGEANGGTAFCSIVTVMDNLGRFRSRHPYNYCKQYFEKLTSVEGAESVRQISNL